MSPSLLIFIFFIFYIMCTEIYEYYLTQDPMILNLINELKPFFKNTTFKNKLSVLNNINIFDKIKIVKGNKSYTINKQKIYLCLKQKNGEYYNKNMLMYVLLHEISHTICNSVGHTEEFHEIFNELLQEAINYGVYNNKIPLIIDYCENGSG